MTIDIDRATKMLTQAMLEALGDEVDLIFRYGSHLKGTAHAYSDLDISLVPVHESTWKSITVIVDEVMIDFYALHWSRLEAMANFDDVGGTLLAKSEIVYQRTEAVGERFWALPKRLQALQQPEARPEMLKKAQDIFQKLGYPYYLLQQQAQAGHALACMHHARNILRGVLHCLSVCNQKCVDTRKLDQVLALPKLPIAFADTVDHVTKAHDPTDVLNACETLLGTTRALLLTEQQEVQRCEPSFRIILNEAYPELKGDLQHVMLACEREDRFHMTLFSLYHELMIHTKMALTGVEYSDFNTLSEYELDLVAMGFPDLLSYLNAGDFAGLHQQCKVFDRRLREFLTEHDVPLNAFDTLDELQAYIDKEWRAANKQ